MAKQVIWSLVAKKQLKEAFQILKLKNGNNEVGEVLYYNYRTYYTASA